VLYYRLHFFALIQHVQIIFNCRGGKNLQRIINKHGEEGEENTTKEKKEKTRAEQGDEKAEGVARMERG
jgi:hypothetical protein